MSLEVVCCFEDDTAEHARELMADHNIRRLPVIDHDHRLVGIVKLPELEGQELQTKKAIKVTLQKEKTDSYGRPHKVPIRTMYITGVKDKGAAEVAALERVEEEGTVWTNVANSFEVKEVAVSERPDWLAAICRR
jgi:CBS-domain-containing membrane protein